VDSYLQRGVSDRDVQRWVPSVCLLCSNGRGIDIAVSDNRMVGVRGRESDRVSRGRLGPKGLYGRQGELRDRLTEPLLRNAAGRLEPVDWDTAMDAIVTRSRQLLAECDARVDRLIPLAGRYEARREAAPERLHATPLNQARTGPLGLPRDLQDLYALAGLVVLTCSLVRQAGLGLDDPQMVEVAGACRDRPQAQLDWRRTRLHQAAPRALIVG
jgi:hypothetical protein